jgi:ketohexokinase
MSNILTVGIATLDIINFVEHFPQEDEELRATQQRIACGGNAANTASVLAQYGHKVELAATLADEPDGHRIEQQLTARHVATQYCELASNGKVPTSYITLNQQTGSRTIVHYRDLLEYDYEHFKRIPLETFDWFHFEGRNVAAVKKMLLETQHRRVNQPISLEIEKERDDIDALLPLADILLFSKTFATARSCHNAPEFFDMIRPHAPDAMLLCTWGEQGAWGRDNNNQDFHVPAYTPPKVIDTLAAGDTFNAGIIHSLAGGTTLPEAIDHACQLAGKKVGQSGIEGLISQVSNGK